MNLLRILNRQYSVHNVLAHCVIHSSFLSICSFTSCLNGTLISDTPSYFHRSVVPLQIRKAWLLLYQIRFACRCFSHLSIFSCNIIAWNVTYINISLYCTPFPTNVKHIFICKYIVSNSLNFIFEYLIISSLWLLHSLHIPWQLDGLSVQCVYNETPWFYRTGCLQWNALFLEMFQNRQILFFSGVKGLLCSLWSEIRVRFPELPDCLWSSGSGTGSTHPREYKWGAAWKRK
jgi:hypothetical protein